MRTIVSSADGPVLKDIPLPKPGRDEVLVRVGAASLNRADLAMLKGSAHGRVGGMGSALGLEWAGEVVEIGEAVKNWRVGDRVMAAGGGAFFLLLLHQMPAAARTTMGPPTAATRP